MDRLAAERWRYEQYQRAQRARRTEQLGDVVTHLVLATGLLDTALPATRTRQPDERRPLELESSVGADQPEAAETADIVPFSPEQRRGMGRGVLQISEIGYALESAA